MRLAETGTPALVQTPPQLLVSGQVRYTTMGTVKLTGVPGSRTLTSGLAFPRAIDLVQAPGFRMQAIPALPAARRVSGLTTIARQKAAASARWIGMKAWLGFMRDLSS